jgi:hypothetical protein
MELKVRFSHDFRNVLLGKNFHYVSSNRKQIKKITSVKITLSQNEANAYASMNIALFKII